MTTENSSFFANRQRGAALLIVLLIVATLSVVALAIVQSMMLSARVAVLSSSRSQALWFVSGAEDLTQSRLTQAFKLTEGKFDLQTPGLYEEIRFEIPGGEITALIVDYTNCFNLNALLPRQGDDGQGGDADASTSAAGYFREMLVALDVSPSTANELIDGITDWIDADTSPRQRGAENGYYANLEAPYLPANGPLKTPEELRAIRGISVEMYRLIRPYVCVLPSAEMHSFNINTMTEGHAPLLVPAFSSELDVNAIRLELIDKGLTPFGTVEDFFSRQLFSEIAQEKRRADVLDVKSRYFKMTGEVVYLDGVTSYEAVFEISTTGEVTLLRRRLGVDG